MGKIDITHSHLAMLGWPEIVGMLFLVLVPVCLAFWIWMIVDCALYEKSTGARVGWLLLIILVACIGAPLYLFIRKLPRRREVTTPAGPRGPDCPLI